MGEVSNKSLATLLVVAIVVSLGGTFISLNRLSSLGRVPLITGFQTTGEVNVSITEVTTISAPEAIIWFGEGTVAAGTDAELWSNGTKINWNNASSWMPDPAYTGEGSENKSEDFIVIENTGNVHLNISVYTEKNASEYLCDNLAGPTFVACDTVAEYKYWSLENETGSCDSDHVEGTVGSPTSFIGNGTQPRQQVCGSLRSAAENDTVRLYVYLKIPEEVTGSKTDTLTFNSAKSGAQD
ncbi:hypothetical protein KY361_05695 [Candidatus Woesearchaeota archaeon]|nr:hypothetical protein [Candidatus Woesearchaeota archaeon]